MSSRDSSRASPSPPWCGAPSKHSGIAARSRRPHQTRVGHEVNQNDTGGGSRMTNAKSAAHAVQESTVFRTIARIGYVVLGIVHIVIGTLAISITSGGG